MIIDKRSENPLSMKGIHIDNKSILNSRNKLVSDQIEDLFVSLDLVEDNLEMIVKFLSTIIIKLEEFNRFFYMVYSFGFPAIDDIELFMKIYKDILIYFEDISYYLSFYQQSTNIKEVLDRFSWKLNILSKPKLLRLIKEKNLNIRIIQILDNPMNPFIYLYDHIAPFIDIYNNCIAPKLGQEVTTKLKLEEELEAEYAKLKSEANAVFCAHKTIEG